MPDQTPLAEERSFYAQHVADWLPDHSGKYVLVKHSELVGFYDTADNALAEGARRFGLTSFLVRQVQAMQQEIQTPALTLGILDANTL